MRTLANSLLAKAENRIVYRQECDQLGHTAEHGEQQRMGAEVAFRTHVGLGERHKLIEDRPQPLDLTFSEMRHLHRLGVELRCEVAGSVTVGNEVEVPPKQMLDQIVVSIKSVETVASRSG